MRSSISLTGCALLLVCGVSVARGENLIPWPESRNGDGHLVAPTVQPWHFCWEKNFQSTEGRSIETMRIGNGPFRTLVVGSVHGNEPTAVAVVEELARYLGNQFDRWDRVNVHLIRTPNPDGFGRQVRLNSRGIDLNRNFPSGDFRVLRHLHSGPAAASEIETAAVVRLIDGFRPQRVIHIKSTRNQFGWALCNRRAHALAAMLSQFRNLQVGALEEHLTPGSLESYSSGSLSLETVTIAIPHAPGTDAIWREYRNVLLAAAAYVNPIRRRPYINAGRNLVRPGINSLENFSGNPFSRSFDGQQKPSVPTRPSRQQMHSPPLRFLPVNASPIWVSPLR